MPATTRTTQNSTKTQPRKRKTPASKTPSAPNPKRPRTRLTASALPQDGPETTQMAVIMVPRDVSEARPLTTANIPAIVNAVLEARQSSSAQTDDRPKDHPPAVTPRYSARLFGNTLNQTPDKDTTDFGKRIPACIVTCTWYLILLPPADMYTNKHIFYI